MDIGRNRRWSKAIRNRDRNKCIHCGEEEAICAAHLVGRGDHITRYILENGITACKMLHDRIDLVGEDIKIETLKFYKLDKIYYNLLKISKGQAKLEDYGYTIIE